MLIMSIKYHVAINYLSGIQSELSTLLSNYFSDEQQRMLYLSTLQI